MAEDVTVNDAQMAAVIHQAQTSIALADAYIGRKAPNIATTKAAITAAAAAITAAATALTT